MLNLDALLPGGIILSRSSDGQSRLTAFFAKGAFSHAEVVVDRFDLRSDDIRTIRTNSRITNPVPLLVWRDLNLPIVPICAHGAVDNLEGPVG
jgi:hypothetical protein